MMLFALFFPSCERKSCTDVVCPGVYTICIDGNCYCQAGWEGDNCDEETRLKYIGAYRVTENCTTSNGGFENHTFNANITSPSSRADIFYIDNFTYYGGYVEANIIDATTFIIQDQNTLSLEISGGQGRYHPFNRSITVEYNYKFSNTAYACTANYYR